MKLDNEKNVFVHAKLTTEIIPQLIRSINETTAKLKKKRRKALILKTDKKKIRKVIDKLSKRLILESAGDYFAEDIKNGEVIVTNGEAYLEKSNITLQEPDKVLPHKIYDPLMVYRALLQKTLMDNNTQLPIKKDKNDELNTNSEQSDITSQESIKVALQKHDPIALYRALLHKKLVDNNTKIRIQKDKNEESNNNSEQSDIVSQESIKVPPQKHDLLALYRALLHKKLVDNNTQLTIKKDKHDKPNLINLEKSVITLQEPVKLRVPPQKYDPLAPYRALLKKTLIENKIQLPKRKNKNTQPITDSFPSKIKQELVKEGKDPINKVLPIDDELGRVFQAKCHKRVLVKDVVPHWKVKYPFRKQKHKVFVMDHQTASKSNQKPQEDRIPLKKTDVPNKRQQSINLQKKSLKINSATSQNQKSASKSKKIPKKDQQPQKQSTVVISDSLSIMSQQSLLDVKLINKDENKHAKIIRHENKTQVPETSNHNSFKIRYTSKASQTKTTGKVSSKLPIGSRRLKTMTPKASREQELKVIKLPEDSDCVDEFIPPVAHKNYVTNANIIKIEELSEDETDDDLKEEAKRELQMIGESFETGEWFETATIISKSDSLVVLLSKLHRKVSSSNSELYSKCKLPIKENSESHLKVSNYSRKTNEDIPTHTSRALKHVKSGRGKSTSSGLVAALDKTRYLDQFNSSDDFDETLQQLLDKKESLHKQKSGNRIVYEFKDDSDFSEDEFVRTYEKKNKK